jgi:hypothetical protein
LDAAEAIAAMTEKPVVITAAVEDDLPDEAQPTGEGGKHAPAAADKRPRA